MAEKRMFSKAIVDSDVFLEMPLSAQALYFHLSMNADDEGFVGNPKRIMRMLGTSEDDFKLLIVKRFLLTWESGIVVIKHWKINNYIQSDRFRPTTYTEERATLAIDEKKAYTELKNGMDTQCIQPVSKMDAQYSIGKYSIGKVSIGEGNSARVQRDELSTPTPGAIGDLFSDFGLIMDTQPIFEKDTYEQLKYAMGFSSFARSTIKTLSQLHKHANAIITGQWIDYKKESNKDADPLDTLLADLDSYGKSITETED